MERVLHDSNKIILEGSASSSGVLPYLPLDQLRSRPATGRTQTPPASVQGQEVAQ
jgi:membrane protease subunit HflK